MKEFLKEVFVIFCFVVGGTFIGIFMEDCLKIVEPSVYGGVFFVLGTFYAEFLSKT